MPHEKVRSIARCLGCFWSCDKFRMEGAVSNQNKALSAGPPHLPWPVVGGDHKLQAQQHVQVMW